MLVLLAVAAIGVQAARAPMPGDSLAPFQLETNANQTYEWKPGRVTLVTFCAYWCDTWKTQLQRVAHAKEMLGDMPVDYLAVSIDGRWTELGKPAPYLSKLTKLKDAGGAWSLGLGIRTVPFTVVTDSEGRVRWSGQGVRRSEEMAGLIRGAFSRSNTGGTVYLTFDDFPKENAYAVLDTLRRCGVNATFFCVCSRAVPDAHILKQAIENGNSVQIHCWVHDKNEVDIAKCVGTLTLADGVAPTLVRRPGEEEIDRLDGSKLDNPIIDPYDFQRPGVPELLRRVLSNLRPGSEIQLHAGVSDTLVALPDLIAGIRKQNFGFGVLR